MHDPNCFAGTHRMNSGMNFGWKENGKSQGVRKSTFRPNLHWFGFYPDGSLTWCDKSASMMSMKLPVACFMPWMYAVPEIVKENLSRARQRGLKIYSKVSLWRMIEEETNLPKPSFPGRGRKTCRVKGYNIVYCVMGIGNFWFSLA